jgi:hypothetical protein
MILIIPPTLLPQCQSEIHVHSVLCATKKGQHHERRYNCENRRVALCAAAFPMLPYGGQLLEARKRGKEMSEC